MDDSILSSYLCKRIISFIPTILASILLTLFLLRLAPGGPVDQILGEYASLEEKNILRKQLGLDQGLLLQSAHYLWNVLSGDLGRSLIYNKPVLVLIMERLPATLELAFLSVLLALFLGIITGLGAAMYRGKLQDHSFMILALLGIAIPNFWLGPLLIIIFSIKLNLLPVSGYSSPSHYILPVITMGLSLMAIISRITKESLNNNLNADYVRTAQSKGLSSFYILFTHVLKNSAIPVVTIVSLQFSVLLAGAVVTESIFDWPGVGSLVLEALKNRDYPLVQGCVLFFCFSYGVIGLLTDLIYVVLDPRISLNK